MAELPTICKLALLLSPALALLGCTCAQETTSLGRLLDCWFVEEVGGHTGSFARGVTQKKALLLVLHSAQRPASLDFTPPQDVGPSLIFDIIDPTRKILNPAFRRHPLERAPSCELSPFRPQAAFMDWALSLTQEQQSPQDLGGVWYTSVLQDPRHTFSIASIHKEVQVPRDDKVPTRSTEVALSVFTHTPQVSARLGSAVLLDCGFSAPRDQRFSVEWRYQFQGSGDVVYAYDGVTDRVVVAQEGAEMFFQQMHRRGNASLLLHDVRIKDEGTYLCIIYTPYLHVQQAVELRIAEPPKVSLRPEPLHVIPGRDEVLECEASAYYPLDVTVEWLRRNVSAGEAEYLTGSWQSTQRRNPNGTFTVSSYVKVRASAEEHGALYTCYVSHSSLKTGAKKSLRLVVAGESGPSMDDAIGLFITAFLICGLLTFISTKVSPLLGQRKVPGKEESGTQKAKVE